MELEIHEWRKFRRTLRKEDQEAFNQLFETARLHVGTGEDVGRPWPFEVILISMLLEREKEMDELRKKIRGGKEKEDGVREKRKASKAGSPLFLKSGWSVPS